VRLDAESHAEAVDDIVSVRLCAAERPREHREGDPSTPCHPSDLTRSRRRSQSAARRNTCSSTAPSSGLLRDGVVRSEPIHPPARVPQAAPKDPRHERSGDPQDDCGVLREDSTCPQGPWLRHFFERARNRDATLAAATPMPSRSPHDALFKASMQDPARAADLLRLVLRPEIFAQLDVASLRIEPNTFVDAKSAELQSDLLLSVEYGGTPSFVYVLLEHKSYLDRSVRLQMLGYIVAIWRSTAGVRGAPLRPIVPILISHAEGGSSMPTRLADLFGSVLHTHPELLRFVPEFDLVHEDLRNRDDTSLRRASLDPGVLMTLLALRDARRGELLATLRRFMLELRALAQLRDTAPIYRKIVRYIGEVVPDLSMTNSMRYCRTRKPRERTPCPLLQNDTARKDSGRSFAGCWPRSSVTSTRATSSGSRAPTRKSSSASAIA
jgi:hypothetical protein